jgi:Bacterial antitoxin of type II TA system, VapB
LQFALTLTWAQRYALLPTLRFNNLWGDLHMATKLSIDPELVKRALEVSGERTEEAAVTKALQEFVARRRQQGLLDLMGKFEWDSAYDYKAERARN